MSNRLTTRIDFFTLLFYPLEISSIPYEKCIDGAEPIKSRIVISKLSLIEKKEQYTIVRAYIHTYCGFIIGLIITSVKLHTTAFVCDIQFVLYTILQSDI